MAIIQTHFRLSVVYFDGTKFSWEFSCTEDECAYTRARLVIKFNHGDLMVDAKLEIVEPDGSTTPWLTELELLHGVVPI